MASSLNKDFVAVWTIDTIETRKHYSDFEELIDDVTVWIMQIHTGLHNRKGVVIHSKTSEGTTVFASFSIVGELQVMHTQLSTRMHMHVSHGEGNMSRAISPGEVLLVVRSYFFTP